MTQLLEAKAVAAQIRAEVAAGAREIETRAGRPPGLAVVLVGDDPASRVYVASKTRACAEAGLASFGHILPATTAAADLLALLDQLNADPRVDGILVQMPLPAGLPSRDILDRVDPAKDVDGFHPVNVGRLWLDQPGFVPCTPAGIIESLRRHGIALAGRHAVVVGRSPIAGDYLGRDAVFGQFGRYGGETGGTFRADLQQLFTADDGRVIGLHHNSATRNGKQLDTACCIVFEVENGRMVSGREHFFDLNNWDEFWS